MYEEQFFLKSQFSSVSSIYGISREFINENRRSDPFPNTTPRGNSLTRDLIMFTIP